LGWQRSWRAPAGLSGSNRSKGWEAFFISRCLRRRPSI
jgi:hypothetical protein